MYSNPTVGGNAMMYILSHNWVNQYRPFIPSDNMRLRGPKSQEALLSCIPLDSTRHCSGEGEGAEEKVP